MRKRLSELSTWEESSQQMPSTVPAEDWEQTRAQTVLATQLLATQDDYLSGESRDVGRRIDARQHEMFVSCDPGEALHQQFDQLRPEYIAIHDVGGSQSRRLIAGLAAAAAAKVQKLTIRRQGYGVSLATIEFVELPSDGRNLRVYTTEVDADTHVRHQISRVLLAHSRLGVVIVGDLPPHALSSALAPLAEGIRVGPWSNRDLLFLPLSSASAIAANASTLGAGRGINVRTTPQVARPGDAWNFITATWNRLRESLLRSGVTLPELGVGQPVQAGLHPQLAHAPVQPSARKRAEPVPSTAPQPVVATPAVAASRSSGPVVSPLAEPTAAAPKSQRPLPHAATRPPVHATVATPASPESTKLPLHAMPPTPRLPERGLNSPDPLVRYVNRLLEITGMVSACVFEVATQRPLAHAGARPGPAMLAIQGGMLTGVMLDTSRALGFGMTPPEASITLGGHHLLLRPLPGHSDMMLHAVLDGAAANPTLARLELSKLDGEVFAQAASA